MSDDIIPSFIDISSIHTEHAHLTLISTPLDTSFDVLFIQYFLLLFYKFFIIVLQIDLFEPNQQVTNCVLSQVKRAKLYDEYGLAGIV